MPEVALRRVVLLLAGLLAAAVIAPGPASAQDYEEDPAPVEWVEEDPDAHEGDDEWDEGEPADAPLPPEELPTDTDDPDFDEAEELEEPEPLLPTIPVPTTRTIKGKIAYVRADGKAAIPRSAPKRVKRVIAAANEIVGKPYKWGGGHARLKDKGYDCSGTVGYALIRAGLLHTTMTSGQFAKWGDKHEGRHITIYANKGHVYLEVAGLRLDTSPVSDPRGGKGPRWRPVIGRRAGFKARHPLGL